MDAHTDDFEQLDAAMQQLNKAVRRPQHWAHMAAIAGVDIDRPAAALLHILNHSTQNRVQDVAQKLGVEPPSVTRKAQELERLGLLDRIPDPKDKRAVALQITGAGREISEKLWAAKQAFMASVISDWTEADRHQFAQLFTKFADDVIARTDAQH